MPVLEWIKYPAEPLQYRKIRRRVDKFIESMTNISYPPNVIKEFDTVQIRPNQIFFTSDDEGAQADLQQAQRLCETTETLAKVFKEASFCGGDHAAHIHLSGFEKSEIDMLISLCGSNEKWHVVHWASASLPSLSEAQHTPTGPICSVLNDAYTRKAPLRIQLLGGDYWNIVPRQGNERVRGVVAPKNTLEEWLYIEEGGELCKEDLFKFPHTKKDRVRLALNFSRSLFCLLGSPLLQGPWKSRSIRVAETTGDPSVSGLNIKPYVELIGDLAEDDEKIERAKSSILHLGVLFWELFIGRKLTILDADRENDDSDDEGTLSNALVRSVEYARNKIMVSDTYFELILNCESLHLDAKAVDQSRGKFHRYIIKPLGEALEELTRSKKKNVGCDAQQDSSQLTHEPTQTSNPVNLLKERNLVRMATHQQQKDYKSSRMCALLDADSQSYQKRFA